MIMLRLGGWRIGIECSPVGVAQAAARRYEAFVENAGDGCDMKVEAQFLPAIANPAAHNALLEARLRPFSEGYLLDEPEINGTISLTRQCASLRLSSSDPLADLEYYLRIVAALVAHQQGGLLLHGAGLVRHGRGHVFIGHSGSGKSTVVALSPQAAALGDDLLLLRPEAKGWVVYGTPFWNWSAGDRSAQTHRAPLAGIYKLVQSCEVRLDSLSLGRATAELVVNCPIVNGVEALIPGLMALCRQVALAVPVRSLQFRKDPAFWRLIEPEKATI